MISNSPSLKPLAIRPASASPNIRVLFQGIANAGDDRVPSPLFASWIIHAHTLDYSIVEIAPRVPDHGAMIAGDR